MRYYSSGELNRLRESVTAGLSEKRARHVLGVEIETERLCKLLLPGEENESTMRAAALLHDITKEYTVEEHVRILRESGVEPTEIELAAPKTLHAISGECLIRRAMPLFRDPDILSAVRWHTTGRAAMSLPEKILYLADYIEPYRVWPDCVELRSRFWDAEPEKMTPGELEKHLRDVLILSFDMTLRTLIEDGTPVHPATNEARNGLLRERAASEEKN